MDPPSPCREIGDHEAELDGTLPNLNLAEGISRECGDCGLTVVAGSTKPDVGSVDYKTQ